MLQSIHNCSQVMFTIPMDPIYLNSLLKALIMLFIPMDPSLRPPLVMSTPSSTIPMPSLWLLLMSVNLLPSLTLLLVSTMLQLTLAILVLAVDNMSQITQICVRCDVTI